MDKVKIKMEHICKVFKTRSQNIEALVDINIKVNEREFVSIIGPSGCGKSTLIRIIDDIIKPTSGTVTVDGYTYDNNKPVTRDVVRKFGFIFQEPNLLPWLTVRQNILFPLRVFQDKDKKWRSIADNLLKMGGMNQYEDFYPLALSGGMTQRVGVLRAMSYQPEILLMDEPYGSLDAILREQLDIETMKLWEILKQTIIFITHNVVEAVFLSDRIYVMDTQPGRIIDEVVIDLERPRIPEIKATKEFVRYVEYLTSKIGEVDLSVIK